MERVGGLKEVTYFKGMEIRRFKMFKIARIQKCGTACGENINSQGQTLPKSKVKPWPKMSRPHKTPKIM